MDFDELLQEIGDYGTYQKLVLWFLLLPGTFPCGFNAYNQLFMASTPEHWCKVPELDNANWNLSREAIKNLSIPYDELKGTYSSCQRYDVDYTALLIKANLSEALNFSNAKSVPCDRGWHYQLDPYSTTVVADFDLVCDRSFQPTLALVLLGVSGLIGSYIFGLIQDGYGRRPAFFTYLTLLCVFGMTTPYSNSFSFWLSCRIGVGFTIPAIMTTPFVLAIELVGPSYRTYTTVVMNIAYSFSLIILAMVAYFVRTWSQMALATIIPFLAFFGFWWVLPESPRWLLAKGRVDEAYEIMFTMARVNKQPLRKDFYSSLKEKHLEEQRERIKNKQHSVERKYGVTDLFKTPNLRKKTLIITFIWFANTFVYVGLSYYAPLLGGDAYLNFFLAAVAELPAYLFLWPSMEFWGRRWTICLAMVIGGSACMATFFTHENSVTTLVLYCIGKFGISSSYVVLPLLASELYPTVVRGVGIGLSTTAGMIGPIVIPLINSLGTNTMELPVIIMGTVLVLAGMSSLGLPETLHQHLPETIEEGEEFGNKMTFVDYWNCCPRRRVKKLEKSSKKHKVDLIDKGHENAEIDQIETEGFKGDYNDSYSSLRRNSFLQAQSDHFYVRNSRKETDEIIRNNVSKAKKIDPRAKYEVITKGGLEREMLLPGKKVTKV